MGWVRISDDFYDHPGMVSLSLEAWGLFAWGLAWSNRNLTDGELPINVVRRMDPSGSVCAELVAAGRWEEGDDLLVIHDYHDYQPSAAEVRARRSGLSQVRAEAGRKGAASRWQADGKTMANTQQADGPNPNPNPVDQEHAHEFDAWWADYPKKADKARARAQYLARRRSGTTAAELIAARDNYLAANDGVEARFLKGGAVFLHGQDGPWSEWVAGAPEGLTVVPAPSKSKPSGPEPVMRTRDDGTLERFYPGTGWVAEKGLAVPVRGVG